MSVGELLNNLRQTRISPEDICSVYKVSQNDFTFSVCFQFEDAVRHVAALKKVKMGNTEFDIVKMNEQIVNLRVHWLPLFYDSLILKEIFDSFGEVLNVTMLKSAHKESVVFDGMREVRLSTENYRKDGSRMLYICSQGKVSL